MANSVELMDFVKWLDDTGLLKKAIEEFDYERVIRDYEKSKLKNLFPSTNLFDTVCLHEWDEGYQNVSKCKKCGKYSDKH